MPTGDKACGYTGAHIDVDQIFDPPALAEAQLRLEGAAHIVIREGGQGIALGKHLADGKRCLPAAGDFQPEPFFAVDAAHQPQAYGLDRGAALRQKCIQCAANQVHGLLLGQCAGGVAAGAQNLACFCDLAHKQLGAAQIDANIGVHASGSSIKSAHRESQRQAEPTQISRNVALLFCGQ